MIGEGELGDGDEEEVAPLGEVGRLKIEGDGDEALDVLEGSGIGQRGGGEGGRRRAWRRWLEVERRSGAQP